MKEVNLIFSTEEFEEILTALKLTGVKNDSINAVEEQEDGVEKADEKLELFLKGVILHEVGNITQLEKCRLQHNVVKQNKDVW